MLFAVTLCGLSLIALLLYYHSKKTTLLAKNLQFEKLQNEYLMVYYLATIADWLQGPYVYKLYSDYGYDEEEIAILYIAGFASSSLFGAVVGYFADRYGRKNLCFLFGLLYSICCLTKLSPNYYVLFLGRILGGVSTSILFSTFEAWYINEHVNYLNLPQEWINATLSKACFSTGFLAIVAGIISQISAETLNFGSISPFIIAIPFLLSSSYLINRTWEEHPLRQANRQQNFLAPVYLILCKERILLILGFILSIFEAVMYTFIFSWTPLLSELSPPYGIVFASFMLAFMMGSKVYGMWLANHMAPEVVLIATSAVSFLSICTISVVISYVLQSLEQDSISKNTLTFLTQICFVCFLVYEFTLGVYWPMVGYLKSKVLPEEHRASLVNWFRLPMNIFTCFTLTINQKNQSSLKNVSTTVEIFKKFHPIYILCSGFMLITIVASFEFKKRYKKRFLKEEFSEEHELIKTLGHNLS